MQIQISKAYLGAVGASLDVGGCSLEGVPFSFTLLGSVLTGDELTVTLSELVMSDGCGGVIVPKACPSLKKTCTEVIVKQLYPSYRDLTACGNVSESSTLLRGTLQV